RCAAVPLRACSLFSFWSRRSRRSTLFPYTTLFRSEDARLRAEGCGRTEGCGADRHERTQAECDLSEQRATNGGQHAREGTDASQDRKSTRLNSSHVSISYAVFCLKKKNIKQATYIH